jgi:cell division GTPase FtsZ
MGSKTPRTDKEIGELWKGVPAAFVSVRFARELEEELNSAKREIEELRKFVPEYIVPAKV